MKILSRKEKTKTAVKFESLAIKFKQNDNEIQFYSHLLAAVLPAENSKLKCPDIIN